MKYGLLIFVICFVLYELFEHLILPLFWIIRYRKRKSAYGPSGMIGKKCRVKQWEGTHGKVWIGAELWRASSRSPLKAGDEPVIQAIEGLTLRVSASDSLPDVRLKNADPQ